MYFAKNTQHRIQLDDSNENAEEPPNISKIILIKFGGNAMKDKSIIANVIENISFLNNSGYNVIVVHGGGPAIAETLDLAKVKSEFIGGHRKTDKQAMNYVEMALKGKVNAELVRVFNSYGVKAVGISGKDAAFVKADKRYHIEENNQKIDLGFVGDVSSVDTKLMNLLIQNDFVPVVAPIAIGKDFENYNVNADMFAGHLAAAFKVSYFFAMTDVDGLLKNKENPDSLIKEISPIEIRNEIMPTIEGGMIPKLEACLIAVDSGVEKAFIINGTQKNILKDVVINKKTFGTLIKKLDKSITYK